MPKHGFAWTCALVNLAQDHEDVVMQTPPRCAYNLALGSLLAVCASLPAAADPAEDHRIQGWTLAAQLCSQCHVIGRGLQEGGSVGPSFRAIANMPSTTGSALNVFLQNHHQRMPSLRLDREEMDAVTDYILSLKAAQAAE
ncbi:mono/diheme cytochrome c family protein [Methylobacterium sp. BE186]|uniref:c-type cytochrome n=1 Tax=Methylobacterium sp. BE186 TaxID=2817715 RepID=UPI002858240C|nr:cytochrome C552 [Methylobacterium sp. BE186]MDR7036016.1 mono/diheme cytochrome c family protein [Methylobacterium sp. BE186]